MLAPATPSNEVARLGALREYQILDKAAEPGFDAITRLAAHIFEAPIARVSLVDVDRQWFTSAHGLDAVEVFCDLMTPFLSGIELHRRAAERDPALADRFVFMSGGVTRAEAQPFLDRVPNGRMEKPFGAQNLRGVARRFVAWTRGDVVPSPR